MTTSSGDGPPSRCFPPGSVLVRQGDEGDRAWVVASGELEVMLTSPDGLTRRLAVLGPGAVVGEMALIDDGARSATVRALTAVRATEISRDALRGLLRRGPPLTGYLLESLIAAIRRTYGLPQRERLLGGADIRSTATFEKVVDRRLFREGHTFFRQGDEGMAAYLIQSGSVAILREDQEIARLGPGRIFGELALLTRHPRAAAAVACEATVCEIIRKETISQAMERMPPVLRSLATIYITQITGLCR